MTKIIFALVFAIGVYGVNSQCNRQCNPLDVEVCAGDHHRVHCQRITQCELDKENCRRTAANLPTISNLAPVSCRDLARPGGKGPCTPAHRLKRNVGRNCNRIPCTPKERAIQVCARCVHYSCQRVTLCELKRVNCRRGQSNPLTVTDIRRCGGMKLGQVLQKCKPVTHKG